MKRENKTFLQVIKEREQTYEFSSRKVSNTYLMKILEAAHWAPSCGNSQPWKFLIIEKRETLSEIFHQGLHHVFYPSFPTLPHLMVGFILDESCVKDKHECSDGKELTASDPALSVAMAVSQATLTAASLGIKSGIFTPRRKEVNKILKRKDVLLLVAFGYEREGAYKRTRERKNLKKLIVREKN